MKRLALVVAFFAAASCSRADETPVDTTLPAMAPAPATTPMDTGMKMDTTAGTTTKAKTP
jgi:hypothetical protein